MLLNTDFAPVMKSSQNMETSKASIDMTPEMFQLLSKGVYQHPERAAVRELSTNGLDGNLMAGNKGVPLHVHLPTQLEPYFEVRDFGTGMTHDQIMRIYMTYGASTKRGSNDEIGGLGIGSKSPFAIAESFTVTSFVDGTVRRYSVYMEMGIPQVTKLTESPTDEPNGLCVRVAVPFNRITKLIEEAQLIYTHFPVKPQCNLPLVGIYDDERILAEIPGEFTVYSEGSNYNGMTTSIVMGNIEYPIDMADVMPNYQESIPKYVRRNIRHTLIHMPIGSVNIAASRETLQLTDRTREAIAEVFSKVSKEILGQFQSKIDTAKDLFTAVKLFNEAVDSSNQPDLLAHLTFDGKTLLDWKKELDICRSEVELNSQGLSFTRGSRVARKFTQPAFTYSRIYAILSSTTKRIETYTIQDERHFSLFAEMRPKYLEESVAFIIEDRVHKNGTKKVVGRNSILRAIAEDFYKQTGERDGKFIFVESEQDVFDMAKLQYYPRDALRMYKTSDYAAAYVPKKLVRGTVKLWQCINGNGLSDVKVSLDDYEEPQYYIKAEGNDIISDTLRKTGDIRHQMEIISQVVPTKVLFMFRKTVWNKIPEDWIEVTEETFEEAVKENPHWWIELNRSALCGVSRGKRPEITRMNMVHSSSFDRIKIIDGYHEKTRGECVNFEDNLDVVHKMFGRPQIIFADAYYSKYIRSSCILEHLKKSLKSNSKLRQKIDKAWNRSISNFKKERNKFNEKNTLISWIDWGKVTFRKFAEYLGYTLTPYVDK